MTLGRSLFLQSCGECHLTPQLGAPRYAPALSRDSVGGQESAMREVIANGTPRMPGFKYNFTPQQIAAIASYLKTVPPAERGAGPGCRHTRATGAIRTRIGANGEITNSE